MRPNRALKRKQIAKIRKEHKQKVKEFAKAVSEMPDSCSECSRKFDPKDQEHLDKWRVRVMPEKVVMVCDQCFVPETAEVADAEQNQG